jgi:hypothetical protein
LTEGYLSILSQLRGKENWYALSVLADSQVLGDPAVTARIVEFGNYSRWEQEKAHQTVTHRKVGN